MLVRGVNMTGDRRDDRSLSAPIPFTLTLSHEAEGICWLSDEVSRRIRIGAERLGSDSNAFY